MNTALERVSTIAVEIEPSASRDQDALALPASVPEPLHQPTPTSTLVNLVENPELVWREMLCEEALAIGRHIPVEITGSRQSYRPVELPRGTPSSVQDHARSGRGDIAHRSFDHDAALFDWCQNLPRAPMDIDSGLAQGATRKRFVALCRRLERLFSAPRSVARWRVSCDVFDWRFDERHSHQPGV